MAGRVVSSGSPHGRGKAPAGRTGARRTSSGQARLPKYGHGPKPSDAPAVTVPPQGGGRVARSTRSHDPSQRHPSRSASGQFVDARALDSEDIVAKTLAESEGALGLATRPKVVDFKARLKERRRARLRAMALRVAAIVAAAAALAALAWLLFLSPALRLEASQIRVTGANEWVSATDITGIVGEQAGRSLLLLDTASMTERMGAIPGVTKAEVTRRFPHGVDVAITAQRPAAMLKAGDDALTAVDARGRVLNSVRGADTAGVPVIEVKDVDHALKGRSVKTALKVLDALPESMRARITKVTAETQDAVRTELDGGAHTVVWGDASDLKLKQAIVDTILADPKVIGDKHEVDVSAPNRPVLR
ncbi:FtsQ-type POTRA domain-containing protein [Bifidobacterium pullorum subsp. saeculare]|uniref:FtsQ-type POTRA domain-containing protein n=1 Tax=Bifidobacterium pullorum subsp. saeculare TaxID=78257 RepID=A0A938WW08_9BIFI|nr:FtsQ-type POTRA domain-containing protein [Bifidobacterium pullorum]MBM6698941.1 FtsQ-type POTRA domain-containing protein [Bifidobacterium pullorum subsp. saeculare]